MGLTCRISKRNSTDNASWAEAPTWKLTKSQLTIMCKLGWAPTWRISKEILQTMQVGLGPNMEADEKSTSNISRI